LLIASSERRDELRHLRFPLEATKSFRGFENASGDPADHHRPTAPAFHIALHMTRPTQETFDRIGGGERVTESVGDPETEYGQRLVEPFPDTFSSAGILIRQSAGEILEQAPRGGHVGTGIRAIEDGPDPRPLPFRQMFQHIPSLQSRALARWTPQVVRAQAVSPLSGECPARADRRLRLQHPLIEPYVKFSLIRLSESPSPGGIQHVCATVPCNVYRPARSNRVRGVLQNARRVR